jgi:hypothetical protein
MVCKVKNFVCYYLLAALPILGCGETDIESPPVIGEKNRTAIIEGSEAGESIDQLHGLNVAAKANLIAEYGNDQNKKDLLYISDCETGDAAKQAFDLMTEKIAHATDGPFYHVMPLKAYDGKAFITLGMGATHYIFLSGRFLIWYQTYQSLGPKIPEVLTEMYPVN